LRAAFNLTSLLRFEIALDPHPAVIEGTS